MREFEYTEYLLSDIPYLAPSVIGTAQTRSLGDDVQTLY